MLRLTFKIVQSTRDNRIIARVFHELNLIEQWGSGVRRIFSEAEALGHKTVSGELHEQIRRLLDQKLIEMTLPDKPNTRLQKYRLTAQGRTMVAGSR